MRLSSPSLGLSDVWSTVESLRYLSGIPGHDETKKLYEATLARDLEQMPLETAMYIAMQVETPCSVARDTQLTFQDFLNQQAPAVYFGNESYL